MKKIVILLVLVNLLVLVSCSVTNSIPFLTSDSDGSVESSEDHTTMESTTSQKDPLIGTWIEDYEVVVDEERETHRSAEYFFGFLDFSENGTLIAGDDFICGIKSYYERVSDYSFMVYCSDDATEDELFFFIEEINSETMVLEWENEILTFTKAKELSSKDIDADITGLWVSEDDRAIEFFDDGHFVFNSVSTITYSYLDFFTYERYGNIIYIEYSLDDLNSFRIVELSDSKLLLLLDVLEDPIEFVKLPTEKADFSLLPGLWETAGWADKLEFGENGEWIAYVDDQFDFADYITGYYEVVNGSILKVQYEYDGEIINEYTRIISITKDTVQLTNGFCWPTLNQETCTITSWERLD